MSIHIPRPTYDIHIRVDADLWLRLAERAGAENRAKAALVVEAITRYLDEREAPEDDSTNGQPYTTEAPASPRKD